MIRMKATKPLTYRTRRLLADGTAENVSSLKPGDIFEVMKQRDLKLLHATRKAVLMREPVAIPAPPPAVAEKIVATLSGQLSDTLLPVTQPPLPATASVFDDRAALRAEYERVVGKRPFAGWDAITLREKIAAAAAS